MNPHSLVSIDELSKDDILSILDDARYFEQHPNHKILDGKVCATLFFEPSTRTRLSLSLIHISSFPFRASGSDPKGRPQIWSMEERRPSVYP